MLLTLHYCHFLGEMVIEYAGEVIRATLTDKREKYYDGKGIGCYMFRIDDQFVVDATMRGNAARFINHSCEVSCKDIIFCLYCKLHKYIFYFSHTFLCNIVYGLVSLILQN